MKKSDGKDFERLVARVYEIIAQSDGASIVSADEVIKSVDGGRQFDVVIRTRILGEELTTIVECKDYGRPANVTIVDALHSKMADINANKGIIVSRNGFSKTARQKAKRLGISLCTIDMLSSKLESPWASFPILCRKIATDSYRVSFSVPDNAGTIEGGRIDVNSMIAGLGLMQVIGLSDFNVLFASGNLEIGVTEDMIGQQLEVRFTDGRSFPVGNLTLSFSLAGRYFFGYASDLPSSAVKISDDGLTHDVFIDVDDFQKVAHCFAEFQSLSDIPENLRKIHLRAISVPTRIDSVGCVEIYGKRRGTSVYERIR